jgi:hypothetical protein
MLTEDERNNLLSEREIAEGNTTLMIEERKCLEKEVANRRKLMGDKKKNRKIFKRKRRKLICQYRLKSKIFCYNTTS